LHNPGTPRDSKAPAAVISIIASILLLSACAPSAPERYAAAVGATNVPLYRGVKADRTGHVNWTEDSFGVSGTCSPPSG
jgi:hypothetical protein